MKGIKRKFSVPRTPQQNGIAERKNRTIIEAARTMLTDSLLPIPFWAEAVNTVCYVQNRVLVTKPHNKTPYELLHGRTPSIGFMRPFGCLVTILNTLDSLGKFEGKVDEGFLVGYSNYDGDAAFDGKEHDFDAKKPDSEVILSPRSSAQSRKQNDKTKKEDKGKSPVESFTRYRDLSVEFKDCSDNSSNEVNATGTIVSIVGQNSSNNTNPFSAASPSNTTASPTYGKSSFIDASKLSDDLDTPELEDITYSNDENDVGAEADFNNSETSITVYMNKKDERGIVVRNKARLVTQGHTREEGIDYEEVFSPVARIEAIRLFLAYASFMGFMVYQLYVKSAFLYGTIKEEVYVCQPPGFEDPDHPDKVYKVVKALYGLHQAPRACQDKYVAEILKKFRLTEGKSTSTPIDTEKPLLKDPDGKDVDVHTYRSMIGSLMYLTSSRPDIMFADSPFDLVAYSDSYYVGASLDRKSTTEGCQFLGCRLISCQCKKQIVVATSSTKAEYVAAASCYAQVNDVTRLQALVDKKKVVVIEASIREEEGDADEHVEDVTAGDDAQGDDTAAHGEVPTVTQEPSIPSPTPTIPPSQPPQDIPSTSQVQQTPPQSPQALEITKLKRRVKRWEKGNKARVLKLRRLQKVRTSQRVDTSDDTVMDDESNQGRMIDEMDKDDAVVLMDENEKDKKVEEAKVDENAQKDEPAEVQEVVDIVTTAKLITEVVTATSEIVTAADAIISAAESQVPDVIITAVLTRVAAAPSRRRKGVVIRDPEKESTTSSIISTETKSKDKGKGIMVEEPKPLKKKQQIEMDEEYARKLHAELNEDID
uniref:Integrase catalytic domain-containing protein n=1 Tax=Tanacetum cinerariifolium TaxID=118510 RepID=A0A699HXU7_TANCI|nr:hypothetical protein [Tanacetum cinerariifolium]